jgi:hypothetical protein
MSGKIELWDYKGGTPGGALPIFDVIKGNTVITATPRGVKRIRCRELRCLVKSYPISHKMLKVIGDAAAMAEEEGIYYSVLLTDVWNRKIGFTAFKDC